MKSKTIIFCILVGIVVAGAWQWKRTRFQSQQAGNRIVVLEQRNAPIPAKEIRPVSAVTSSHVIQILENPDEMPALAVLAKLTVDDEAVLLAEYRRKTNMSERCALFWSLAFLGGDASLNAFKHTLTDEYAGRRVGSNPDPENFGEELILRQLVWAIGVMAQKNDKAFDLLKQGTDPWYWHKTAKWKTAFAGDLSGQLAVGTMQAIGMSGRKEVPEILETLSKQPLINEPASTLLKRTMNGGVVDAAFYNSIVREEGRDGFLKWFFTPKSDVFDEDGKFSRWCATDDGKKWRQWSAEYEKASVAREAELLKQARPK